jgi:hypothetical protein
MQRQKERPKRAGVLDFRSGRGFSGAVKRLRQGEADMGLAGETAIAAGFRCGS